MKTVNVYELKTMRHIGMVMFHEDATIKHIELGVLSAFPYLSISKDFFWEVVGTTKR